MATAVVNGVRLFYELQGTASVPLVLVHGSWNSHNAWDLVVPRLARVFRVLTYDRRGHSQSGRPIGQGSVREDVADLAALLDHVGFGPAWVVANSFGASISLRLASEQPGLFLGLVAHEPPLFSLLAGDPNLAPMLEGVQGRIKAVAKRIAAGDHAGGTEQFVETVGLGPGAWKMLPAPVLQRLNENASTFLDETNDPEQFAFDLPRISGFTKPVLFTLGDQSPPTFAPVVRKLSAVLPQAEIVTLPGAGHIPQATHPDAYVDAIIEFKQKHAA